MRGPDALRDSVASVLSELEGLMGHTSRLRLRWYRATAAGFGDLPDSATVSTAELARLVEGGRATLV